MAFWNKWFKHKPKVDNDKESRIAVTFTDGGTAKYTPENYKNFIEETYKKNIVSYRAMFYVAQSISSVPWVLKQKKNNTVDIVIDHEINNILRRPNPNQSWSYLMLSSAIYLQAAGNVFIERIVINKSVNAIPKELYVLRPDKINIHLNENTGSIEKYTYDNKIDYDVDLLTQNADLLQINLFDPLDNFWGMSPIVPGMREIDTSNEGIDYQKKTFENEGRPGLIVSVKGILTDEQFNKLEKQLKEKFTGVKNAKRNLILESAEGVSVTPYSMTPAELDFIESNRELSRKTSLLFGVPPILLGIPGETTYNNYETARLIFWEDTGLFYLNLFRSELNNWLFGQENKDGYFLDYVLDDVPAFTVKRTQIWDRAEKSTFLTINEKREMVGKSPVNGGDVVLVPAMMIPLGAQPEPQEETEEEIDDENKQLQRLILKGYTEQEALEILGLSID